MYQELGGRGTPVVYTPGLEKLMFIETKDCSYQNVTDHMNLSCHRRSGEELAVTTVQDYVSATGEQLRSDVEQHLDDALARFHVEFDKDGSIMDGHSIPESAIHPVIPRDSNTRITKKAVKQVIKRYNTPRDRSLWISYKRSRACLEKDPMHTVYCFIDDICTKHQKEHRSVSGVVTEATKHLQYNTVVYVLYRDQKYSFTAPNTLRGCQMLLGFLLEKHLLENNELFFFSDGADEIRNAVEKVFSFREFHHLLDWFHVRKICYQYFTGMLKGGKGRLEENEEIRKTFFDLLWSGNFEKAREFVENLSSDLIKREEGRQQLLGYMDRKKSRLYEFAVRKGLHLINTSNRVEQANNQLIALRQKKNGMSWCEAGSPALANITMLFVNNEFDSWEATGQLHYRLTKTNGNTCRVEWSWELDAQLRSA